MFLCSIKIGVLFYVCSLDLAKLYDLIVLDVSCRLSRGAYRLGYRLVQYEPSFRTESLYCLQHLLPEVCFHVTVIGCDLGVAFCSGHGS